MKRGLLNLLTALSLLMSVGVAALWVVSAGPMIGGYWFDPLPTGEFRFREYWACAACDVDGVVVVHCQMPRSSGDVSGVYWDWAAAAPENGPLAKVGFNWGAVGVGHRVPVLSNGIFKIITAGQHVRVPWWSLAVFTVATPAIRIVSLFNRRHRRLAGHCPRCGYDLRATPDRCPECGEPPGCGRVGTMALTVRRMPLRMLLVNALVLFYARALMPWRRGGKAIALYVLRSVLQAAMVLSIVVGGCALGMAVASYFPSRWRWLALLVVMGLFSAPLYWLDWWVHRGVGRLKSGECVHCGYNLTGNVSGVCPECGEIRP
jgi:hypothetical protein